MTSPAAPPEPEPSPAQDAPPDPTPDASPAAAASPRRTRWRRCCRWGCGTLTVCLLLAVYLFPKAVEKARRVNCGHNMLGIGLACLMYSGESGGVFPPSLDALVYTDTLPPGRIYECPSNASGVHAYVSPLVDPEHRYTDPAAPPILKSDYVYVGSGMYDDLDDAERCPIMFDAPTNHPGPWLNVLFADGHVEGFPYATWAEVIAAQPGTHWRTPEEGRALSAFDHPPEDHPAPLTDPHRAASCWLLNNSVRIDFCAIRAIV